MSIFLELNKDKSSKYLTWYKYNRICLKSVSFLLSEPEFSSNRFDVITWFFNFLHAWDKVHVSFGRKSISKLCFWKFTPSKIPAIRTTLFIFYKICTSYMSYHVWLIVLRRKGWIHSVHWDKGGFTVEFTKEHLVWKDKACVCLTKNSKITQPPKKWPREENSCNYTLVQLDKTSGFRN